MCIECKYMIQERDLDFRGNCDFFVEEFKKASQPFTHLSSISYKAYQYKASCQVWTPPVTVEKSEIFGQLFEFCVRLASLTFGTD